MGFWLTRSTLHHHHQNISWGSNFWRIYAEMHWNCSGSLWWSRHFNFSILALKISIFLETNAKTMQKDIKLSWLELCIFIGDKIKSDRINKHVYKNKLTRQVLTFSMLVYNEQGRQVQLRFSVFIKNSVTKKKKRQYSETWGRQKLRSLTNRHKTIQDQIRKHKAGSAQTTNQRQEARKGLDSSNTMQE